MDATSQAAETVRGDEESDSDASLSAVAENIFDLGRLWCLLLKTEAELARRNLGPVLIGALLLPVLALSTWLSVMALVCVAVHSFLANWPLALLFAVITQLLLLALLLRFWLRWSHELTLPQSRAALIRATERVS